MRRPAIFGRRSSGWRRFEPRFVSVTYGADGSTRSRTHECVLRILRDTDLVVAPHLTCIGAPREEVIGIAQDYWRQGVRHMVALRGDAAAPAGAAGQAGYRPHPGGFAYASDLVRGIREAAPFEISVAAYPEGHPESGHRRAGSRESEAQGRRGRQRAITQFFFDTDVFLRYRDRCAGARHPREHRAGDSAHHPLSAIAALRGALRRLDPGLAAPPLRRPRRRCGHAPHDRRARGDRAGAAPAPARRRGVPLLHLESRRAHLRDLSCAGDCAPPRGRSGRLHDDGG